MSETMIERVAKAIEERLTGGLSCFRRCDVDFAASSGEIASLARAAIEAMRAPTRPMLAAWLDYYSENGIPWEYSRQGAEIWQAMVSAALSQDTHSLPSEDR